MLSEKSFELGSIAGIELGYCARPGEVDVRVIGAPDVVERAAEIIRARLAGAACCW